MFDFQKLEVYKKSSLFYLHCKEILKATKHEKHVNDQLSRASFSIVLNIAEGSAKSSKADRRNYFTVARGSVFECVAIMDVLKLNQTITEIAYVENLKLADEISRLLFVMIRNLAA